MRYFQLAIHGEDRWHLDVATEQAPLDIWKCEFLKEPPEMRFIARVDGAKTDFTQTGWAGIPIVSARFAECVASIAASEVQRIPAIINGQSRDWEVLNILARPDCIDKVQSRISYYPSNHPEKPGKPRGVLNLVIDPSRTNGYNILRPLDWEVVIVVSAVLKTRLDDLNVTGLEYWPATP